MTAAPLLAAPDAVVVPGAAPSPALSGLRAWWQARQDAKADRYLAERRREHERDARLELRYRWWAACRRPELKLGHRVDVAGDRMSGNGMTPAIVDITVGRDGDPTTLLVELRPGQLVDVLEAVGRELAAALGVPRLRFKPLEPPFVEVTLVEDDPLTGVGGDAAVVPGTLGMGLDEFGHPVQFDPERFQHCAIQGQTGAGKSTALYHLLRQITRIPNATAVGIDPSGLVFRPLPPNPLRVSGLGDLGAIDTALSVLVTEMDARMQRMPKMRDTLPCGVGADSWLFVLLEEFPALLAALELADRKLAARVKLNVGRLTAEGRKVGVRTIIAAQRFEAASVGGAVVRANCPVRVSFRVENATAINFLHDDPDPQIVSEHVRAPAGVALISAPGQSLRRLRFPHVTYRQWAEAA